MGEFSLVDHLRGIVGGGVRIVLVYGEREYEDAFLRDGIGEEYMEADLEGSRREITVFGLGKDRVDDITHVGELRHVIYDTEDALSVQLLLSKHGGCSSASTTNAGPNSSTWSKRRGRGSTSSEMPFPALSRPRRPFAPLEPTGTRTRRGRTRIGRRPVAARPRRGASVRVRRRRRVERDRRRFVRQVVYRGGGVAAVVAVREDVGGVESAAYTVAFSSRGDACSATNGSPRRR